MAREPLDDVGRAETDRLFRQYADWLKAMLRRRFGRAVRDPEDLVQETYLRLAQSGEVRNLRHPQAALMRVADNLAIDHLRRGAVAARGAAGLAVLAEAHAAVARGPDELQQLKAVVLGLPQPFRDTFILSRYANLTHRQIAEHFKISPRTVEWRIAQALALCARRLDD